MAQGKQQLKFENKKKIHAIGLEIIYATDGRGNFDFMCSADIVKQS